MLAFGRVLIAPLKIACAGGVGLMMSFGLAFAGGADVVKAEASQSGNGTWRFDVTVAHDDEGWDHYADAWQVLGPDGAVLGERILHHPHVTEQPFTRSLSGVEISDTITTVTIRARDSVHGYSGKVLELELKR